MTAAVIVSIRVGATPLRAFEAFTEEIGDAPISRPVQRSGSIISQVLLGGLHHHYVRI